MKDLDIAPKTKLASRPGSFAKVYFVITAGFAISLVLFISAGVFLYRTNDKLIESSAWVVHTQQVRAQAAIASTCLSSGDSAARGYLLLGEKPYLDRMNEALGQYSEAFNTLRQLTSDNPRQQSTLVTLNQLFIAKAADLHRVADIRTSKGLAATLAPFSAIHSLDKNRDIRAVFAQIIGEEDRLLAIRTQRLNGDVSARNSAFAAMSAAGMLMLIVSYLFVLRFARHSRIFETQLQNAKHAAEQASSFKTAFLSIMSHELRTPMTAINGFADLLLRPEISESTWLNYVQLIRRNGEHLLRISNDILDLSKVEAGKMSVENVPTAPVEIVSQVLSLLRPRAIEKGIELELKYDGDIPSRVQTDPTRLRQILLNLLGNAIKFTDHGSVRLVVRTDLTDSNQPMMNYCIEDSGIGMTKEEIERLFQPFMQADVSTSRKFGGTGLGLAISRNFAKLLGGNVTVESVLGKGSTFCFNHQAGSLAGIKMLSTPAQLTLATSSLDAAQLPTIDGRILLAEDGFDNQELIALYLREAGADVTIANNGRVARDSVIAAADRATPFDLVLMDMEMPEMDGIAATSALRNHGHKLPIIALTANATSEARDRCLTAGCTAVVTKPVDWAKLFKAILAHLPQARGAARQWRGAPAGEPWATAAAETNFNG